MRKRRGRITIDSGAAESVMPPDEVPEIPIQESDGHKKGLNYVAANGSKMPNLGEKKVRFNTKDGTSSGITFQITNSRKPLASVSKIVKQGNSVTFSPSGSFIQNVRTGRKIDIEEANGTYFIDVEYALGNNCNADEKLYGFHPAGVGAHAPSNCRHEAAVQGMEPMSVRPQNVVVCGGARKVVEKLIEVDGVSDADSGDDGARAPRKVQDPKRPSEPEIAEHELTHLPFRSWCTHCIRGRGEATPHARADRDDSGVPEVHMDYCFLGGQSEEAQPVLVIRERDTKMILSFLVREKGANDPHVIRRVMAFLTELGHSGNNVIIKTDQESPDRAVAAKIAAERQEGRTILENSPVKSSGSNGVIERGVKEFEYQVRTMKSVLDERIGTNVRSDSKGTETGDLEGGDCKQHGHHQQETVVHGHLEGVSPCRCA